MSIFDERLEWLKTPEFKAWSTKWCKEYDKKEKFKQKEIDNNPNSITLYTYEINVDTLEIKSSEERYEDYNEECTGYAEYEESLQSNRVYAESLKSMADAKKHVLNYCKRFVKCVNKMEKKNDKQEQ